MNQLKIFFYDLYKYIIKLSKLLRGILYNFYKYIIFIFNKRKTIKKMYEPIITMKVKEKQLLSNHLKSLNTKNIQIDKDIAKLEETIEDFKKKIDYIEKNLLN